MERALDEVLLEADAISRRVVELAGEIVRDLKSLDDDAEIVLVPVLTGSLIFFADLVRHLPLKLRIQVVTARSYPGAATTSQGPRIEGALPDSFEGRHVLIVDDILDSGRTLRLLRSEILKRSPRSVRACVLLRKQITSALETPCEYIGFDIPNRFVVGYGLDYDDYYRNLPHIAVLRQEDETADERR